MIHSVEAVVDADGRARLLSELKLVGPHRAIVTVLDQIAGPAETAILYEAALAVDWNRPEEDAAWAHLQPAK